jgi:hypothetical protein
MLSIIVRRSQIIKRLEVALIVPLVKHLNGEYDWKADFDRAYWELSSRNREYLSLRTWKKSEGKLKAKLREYFNGWIAAGCDFGAWWKENPALREELNRNISAKRECVLLPAASGMAKILDLTQRDPAADLFTKLITSPLHKGIRRCCRARCGRYFSELGERKKVYHDKKCGSLVSAEKHTKIRRASEHQQKLNRVQRAVRAFASERPQRTDWKIWVAGRASVSTKWITRAVNNHELKLATGMR